MSNFPCQVHLCGKSFEKLSDLVKHLDVHTQGYLCEFCFSVENSRPDLLRHLREKHSQSHLDCIDLTSDPPVQVINITPLCPVATPPVVTLQFVRFV